MGRSIYRSLAANVTLTVGIVLGLKAADYLMWDAPKYEMMKEQIEIDYWKKYGEPSEIPGQLQKSTIQDGEFYVTYLKDKAPEKQLEQDDQRMREINRSILDLIDNDEEGNLLNIEQTRDVQNIQIQPSSQRFMHENMDQLITGPFRPNPLINHRDSLLQDSTTTMMQIDNLANMLVQQSLQRQMLQSSQMPIDEQMIEQDTMNIEENIDEQIINIRIKTMDSSECQIEILKCADVKELKQKIEQKMRVPVGRQRLIFQGKLLKEGTTLASYRIQNLQVVHLVANIQQRPEQNQQQSQTSQAQNQANQPNQRAPIGQGFNLSNTMINGGQGIDLVSEITRSINETNFVRRNRRLVFQQNARQYLQNINLNQRESQEAIRQNIWQMRSMIDSRLTYERSQELMTHASPTNAQINELPVFDLENRKFEIGQWVDVKDTIDQWLEGQIIDIKENQVFIHYNGWGSRWDEWVAANSPRIAAFRTQTVQNPRSFYLSPYPNILPDAANFTSPSNQNELGSLLGDMMGMMQETQTMIQDFKQLREQAASQSTSSQDSARQNIEEEKKQSIEEFSSILEYNEEQKQQHNNPNGRFHFNQNNRYRNADQNIQVVQMAAQLGPIVDRLGRMLTDISPHFNNIVKHHQNLIREGNINAGNQPIRSLLNYVRSTSATQQQVPASQNSFQSITSQDLRNDSLQSQQVPEVAQRPMMIQNQVPIMHSPGDISSVANIFDNRLFEEQQDQNIEFHIHAFLSPPVRGNQSAGAGPSGNIPDQSPIQVQQIPQQAQQMRQRSEANDVIIQSNRQNAQVGPSPLNSSLNRSHNNSQNQLRENSQANQNTDILRQQNQITQTPLDLINRETQTNQSEHFLKNIPMLDQTVQQQVKPQNNQIPFTMTQNPPIYKPVGLFGTLEDQQLVQDLNQPQLISRKSEPSSRLSSFRDTPTQNNNKNMFSNKPKSKPTINIDLRQTQPSLSHKSQFFQQHENDIMDYDEEEVEDEDFVRHQIQEPHEMIKIQNHHPSVQIQGDVNLKESTPLQGQETPRDLECHQQVKQHKDLSETLSPHYNLAATPHANINSQPQSSAEESHLKQLDSQIGSSLTNTKQQQQLGSHVIHDEEEHPQTLFFAADQPNRPCQENLKTLENRLGKRKSRDDGDEQFNQQQSSIKRYRQKDNDKNYANLSEQQNIEQ
eukprot:403376132